MLTVAPSALKRRLTDLAEIRNASIWTLPYDQVQYRGVLGAAVKRSEEDIVAVVEDGDHFVFKRLVDRLFKICRQERVGMEKKEHIARCMGCSEIHLLRPARFTAQDCGAIRF